MSDEHVEPATPEMQVLARIEKKVDCVAECLEGMERRAAVAGAVAGSVSGGLTGGIVATAVLYIKLKLGF
ncbi:MAG: hypothetical protein ACOZEN_08965 [Thermodesulfobacteriota bacterium]